MADPCRHLDVTYEASTPPREAWTCRACGATGLDDVEADRAAIRSGPFACACHAGDLVAHARDLTARRQTSHDCACHGRGRTAYSHHRDDAEKERLRLEAKVEEGTERGEAFLSRLRDLAKVQP